MTTLTLSDAVMLVRKNLDEIGANYTEMFSTDDDNVSLDQTIKRSLPEAINYIHLIAPVELLSWDGAELKPTFTDVSALPTGSALTPEAKELIYHLTADDSGFLAGDYVKWDEDLDNWGLYQDIMNSSVDSATKKVLEFTLPQESRYLRLVGFQTKDSDITVTNVIGSASAEGRKQANKYIRGRYDRPRLVMEQGSASMTTPTFHYYSLKDEYNGSSAAYDNIKFLRIVQEQEFSSAAMEYKICYRVKQNIIDYLTALVLVIFNDQRADSFTQKANNFPLI